MICCSDVELVEIANFKMGIPGVVLLDTTTPSWKLQLTLRQRCHLVLQLSTPLLSIVDMCSYYTDTPTLSTRMHAGHDVVVSFPDPTPPSSAREEGLVTIAGFLVCAELMQQS